MLDALTALRTTLQKPLLKAGLAVVFALFFTLEASSKTGTCDLGLRPLSTEQMEVWLEQYGAEKLEWIEVYGQKFKHESAAIVEVYQKLLSRKNHQVRMGTAAEDYRVYEQPDYPIVRRSHCDKALCALKEIFGREEGVRLAYLYAKYRLNGSHLRYDKASALTSLELDVVLSALEVLPESFFPLAYDYPFIRYQRGEAPDFMTVADSYFRFYDLWAESSRAYQQATVIHEIAHALSKERLQLIELSEEWLTLSTWKNPEAAKKNASRGAQTSDFVSHYASRNPREDFAESFLAYVISPKLLKQQNMAKYLFLRDRVFAGQESTLNADCFPQE